MIKRIKILIQAATLFCFITQISFAQFKLVDSSIIRNWPSVSMPSISDEGGHVFYTIGTGSVASPGGNTQELIIKSIKKDWQLEFKNVEKSNCQFVPKSNMLVALINDTLNFVQLGKGVNDEVIDVTDFKINKGGKTPFITYKHSTADKLILQNLKSGQKKQWTNVRDYFFSDDGSTLLFTSEESLDHERKTAVHLINLSKLDDHIIWQGDMARNFIWNKDCSLLGFTGEGKNSLSIYCFDLKLNSLTPIQPDWNHIDNPKLKIDKLLQFSDDNKRLYFLLKELPEVRKESIEALVEVWNYKDIKLQSIQALNPQPPNFYKASLNIYTGRVIQLEFNKEESGEFKEPYFITTRMLKEADLSEQSWNPNTLKVNVLVNAMTGDRTTLDSASRLYNRLSPAQKFVIYYDKDEKNFFTYEIATQKRRNITANIHTEWHLYGKDEGPHQHINYLPAAWLANDSAVFIPDQYDIWQIDPYGKEPPKNITNGYGKKNHIAFRLLLGQREGNVINANEKFFLSAFGRIDKRNGFYSTTLKKDVDPTLLLFNDNIYYFNELDLGFQPIKATDADVFLVRRESCSESPNLFYTRDFKTLHPITDLHPEAYLNWPSSELKYVKASNGDSIAGILYRPRNFDPKKKYPVLLNYYNKKSQLLNKFIAPDFAIAEINIPWFISRGYLVFTPDIHYKNGFVGKSALDAVLSSANYLSGLSFVDSTKLGIQGSSFGGLETNYIVAHTNRFAAAMSSVGLSNLISFHGSLDVEGGRSYHEFVEDSYIGMQVPPWDDPQRYIENSPIFAVKNIHTPLLIENNKGDNRVDYLQGVQLFLALRRLGKPIWLLQYDKGTHGVLGKDAEDYTQRMTQFFDYYLKGAAMPIWMSKGVLYKDRSIMTGLEYDDNTKKE